MYSFPISRLSPDHCALSPDRREVASDQPPYQDKAAESGRSGLHRQREELIMVRRGTRIVVAALAALFAVLGLATSASAAPYSNQATISVSTTNPAIGGTLTISGSGWAAGETVILTLESSSFSLGSAIANASGDFSTSVTLPSGVSGDHTIVARGATSGATASAAICIGSCGGGGSASSGGGGGLASTGLAVAAIGGLGVVLLIAGGLMLLAGRRRKVID
jgi:hypothetical protein